MINNLKGMLGASKVTNVDKFNELLFPGEEVEHVYKMVLDEVCFTNKRVIFFDNKLISKKKKRVSVPYASIHGFAVEEAGMLDMDADVTLFTRSGNFDLEFIKGTNLIEIEHVLAKYICK